MVAIPDGDFPFRQASGAKMSRFFVHLQTRAIRSLGRL